MERLRRGERIEYFETVRLRKDGTRVDVLVAASPVWNREGRLIGAAAVTRDITTKKAAEKALRTSEARFRGMFESNMMGTFYWRESGAVTDANDAFLTLVGYSRDDLRAGRVSWADMTPPEYRPLDEAGLEEVAATGRCTPFEKEYIRKDGSRVPVLIGGAMLNGDDGVAFALDLTERKRAEERLVRDAVLLANVRESIMVADLDGVVTYWNEGSTRLFGWTAQEMLGRSVTERVPEGVRGEIVARLQILRQGEEVAGEREDYRKDGSRVWVEGRISPICDPAGRTIGFLGLAHDVTDRWLAEEARRASEARFRAIIEKSWDGVALLDANGIPLYASPSMGRILGYAPEELVGLNGLEQVHPDDQHGASEVLARLLASPGISITSANRARHKDGSWRWLESTATNLLEDPSIGAIILNTRDITEARRLEKQFRQAQKMDAFGQLAGGVAHDFNNFLTIINGYSDLLLHDLSPTDPARNLVAEIHKAGERSAGLTRQLLAFSRQQVLAPQVLDLNEVVTEIDKMLRRLIGEDVQLTTTLTSKLWAVRADPGQIEQVLLNLAVNARDAMPKGGRVTIETRNVELDEKYLRTHAEARAGPHVLLSVADTGSGMSPQVKARIFEPFFTTKGQGKGAGLGLATVYGIVKQSSGHVAVNSEVGVGTTIKVYLPRVEEAPEASKAPSRILTPPHGTETVLLAEDESGVRTFISHILAGYGYKMLAAADGDEAVRVAAGHDGPIHLLITDVVMPGAGGRAVAGQVAERHPEVRVLFMSGYTDDAVIRHGVLREEVNFFQKPFSPVALAFKVREVLDTPKPDHLS